MKIIKVLSHFQENFKFYFRIAKQQGIFQTVSMVNNKIVYRLFTFFLKAYNAYLRNYVHLYARNKKKLYILFFARISAVNGL